MQRDAFESVLLIPSLWQKKKTKQNTVVAKVWSSKMMTLNKEWKWVTRHSKSSQLPICDPHPYIRSQILSFTLRRAIEVSKLRFRDFELDEAHSSNKWMCWDLNQSGSDYKVNDFSTKTNCFWRYLKERPIKLEKNFQSMLISPTLYLRTWKVWLLVLNRIDNNDNYWWEEKLD